MFTQGFIITLLFWLSLGVLAFMTPMGWLRVLYVQRWLQVFGSIAILGLGVAASVPVVLPTALLVSTVSPDPLSAFFITLLGIASLGTTLFSVNYLQHFTALQQRRIQGSMCWFIGAMLCVFTVNNSLLFLGAWEIMTLSSYLLVVSIDPSHVNRKAGFLYFSIAHVGLLAIASSLFLLGDMTALFSHLHASSQQVANVVFVLALLGFGAKAGLFPFHVWLPEAHPAAPSPVSALMSGVMLKTAVYGLLRVVFIFLLPNQQLWWGYLLLILAMVSMLVGVILSAVQTDMKRLLAYSSMENLGFILVALALAILFYQDHLIALATLALLVVLLHALNHSLFKTLLFLGTGAILHATGERNLGKLGGLINKMPWVSALTFIGVLSISGVPLLNGFISEWLYLHLFFSGEWHADFTLGILAPILVAISVLVFGIAGFVMIKFFSIAFLGQPRETVLLQAHPSHYLERSGLGILALGCVAIGIFPGAVLQWLLPIINGLIGSATPLLLSPWVLNFSPPTQSGFSPFGLGAVLFMVLLLVVFLVRVWSRAKIRRATAWNGGYPERNARMQDTAEGFSQPFKQIFKTFLHEYIRLPTRHDQVPHYHSQLTEPIWQWLYFPLLALITRLSRYTRYIQQGRLSVYLMFIGITLLVLLVGVVWL